MADIVSISLLILKLGEEDRSLLREKEEATVFSTLSERRSSLWGWFLGLLLLSSSPSETVEYDETPTAATAFAELG